MIYCPIKEMNGKLKRYLIMIFILIIISISGCSILRDKNIQSTDHQTDTAEEIESLETKYLNLFKEALPKAEVVGKVMFDIDNDKEDDLVVIFNNPVDTNKISKSNIAFIMRNDIRALDLASGDFNFQFANGAESITVLDKPKRVSVMMYNAEMNKTIDYQVTVTINKELKETNFKIKTIE